MLSWHCKGEKSKIKKKSSKKLAKGWLMVSHSPDTLVEILFPLMKTWKIYSANALTSENHHAAPEGKWPRY